MSNSFLITKHLISKSKNQTSVALNDTKQPNTESQSPLKQIAKPNQTNGFKEIKDIVVEASASIAHQNVKYDFPQKVKGVNQLKFEMPAAKGENPRPKSQMMK